MSSGPPESASRMSFGSRPSARASEIASAAPSTTASSHVLMMILKRWPAPASPTQRVALPMASKIGSQRSLASSGPDAKTTSSPFSAGSFVPSTGASTKHELVARERSLGEPLRRRDADRASTGSRSLPALAAGAASSMTSSTAGPSARSVIRTSASAAASATEPCDGHTVRSTSGSAFSCVRFHAWTSIARAREISRDGEADRPRSENRDRRLSAHLSRCSRADREPKRSSNVCEQHTPAVSRRLQTTSTERKGSWPN